MSLITCGSIHEGHEWFSAESRGRQEILGVWLLYHVSNFADSLMKVLRYRSSPLHEIIFFSVYNYSSSVLAKSTFIRSKLPSAAC